MKKLTLLFVILATNLTMAQTVKVANVYPSNLEENMYFEKFNSVTNTIEGLYFMVLCDGDNSEYVTPAFEISLYLLPEGSTSKDDLIVVKKYSLDGLYHFGSREFNKQTVNLNATPGIQPGNYRFGIWVNSGESFREDTNDNATLFRTPVQIKVATGGAASNSAPATQDNSWGDWDKDDKKKDDKKDDDDDDGDWW